MAIVAAIAVCYCAAAVPALAQEFTASRLPKELSEAEPGKTHGSGIESPGLETERNQKLNFGPFEILCAAHTYGNTIGQGAVSWESNSTFSTEVRFTKCLTKAHFGAFVAGLHTSFNVNPETKKAEPIKFVYHHNGFAEIGTGETESEVEIESGAANFSITSGKVCKIEWPSQTVPTKAIKHPEEPFSAAVYSTAFVPVPESQFKKFPNNNHEQEKLVIANEFKAMEWVFVGGQCVGEGGFEEAAKNESGKTAKYKGTFEITLNGGNLGFH